MKSKQPLNLKGVTLAETLAVIAIIAVLAAIVLPIVASSKARANQAVCASNLKQIGVAVEMYLENNNREYPATVMYGKLFPVISPIMGGKKSGVLRCPLDFPEGRAGLPWVDRIEPVTYWHNWFLWGRESGRDVWHQLLAVDQNPIIVRCYLHDSYVRSLMYRNRSYEGTSSNADSQVLRVDGSVQFVKQCKDRAPLLIDEEGHAHQDFKGDYWLNATSVPCPDKICDGKFPTDL